MKKLSNALFWLAAILVGGWFIAQVMLFATANSGDWAAFVTDLVHLLAH